MSKTPEFAYFWRVHTRLPDRYLQPCAVLARGKMNSCLVLFTDGFKAVTSRNYLRKMKSPFPPRLSIRLMNAIHEITKTKGTNE